jgi:hypothetical protein
MESTLGILNAVALPTARRVPHDELRDFTASLFQAAGEPQGC